MVSERFSAFSRLLGALALVLLLTHCSGSKKTAGTLDPAQVAAIRAAAADSVMQAMSGRPSANQPVVNLSPPNNDILIQYENNSSKISFVIDPDSSFFMLEMFGVRPNTQDQPQTVVVRDPADSLKAQRNARLVLSTFREAQDLFYEGNYNRALQKINESIEIEETADAYALKGTIYFLLNDIEGTRVNWNKAVRLNPNLPIPNIPELQRIIQQIKRDQ